MFRRLILTALLVVLARPASAEPPPTFVTNFYGGFDRVSQMALGPDGNVYLADAYRYRVAVVDQAGNPTTQIGPFDVPSGVAFDSAGNLYVAEQASDRISKLSPALTLLFTFGSSGSGPGQLTGPTNLAFSPDGLTLYVTELFGHRVSMFDTAGNFLGSFGGPAAGSAPGQFDHPFGIAIDSAGDVFVADQVNNRVQHLSASGAYLGQWGGPGTGPGQFHFCVGLGLDAAEDLYVTDQLNNRVQKFRRDGTFLTEWGTYGPGDGQFYNPWCVLPIAPMRVWVGDTFNYRIGIFETLATPVTSESWGQVKARYR